MAKIEKIASGYKTRVYLGEVEIGKDENGKALTIRAILLLIVGADPNISGADPSFAFHDAPFQQAKTAHLSLG